MISFHIQNSPPDWPRAVSKLPTAAPVKFCFGVERCREAKQANPNCLTWYRWVGPQPLPAGDYEAHARAWLNNFIDATFRREARYVDFIQEYNETLANSQTAAEKARWIALHTAMAKVWHEEYRHEPELAHIKLILCETAIGNDIPLAIARAAVRYDALLGYHPYQVCRLAGGDANFPQVGISQNAASNVRFDAPRANFRDPGLYKMQTTSTAQTPHSELPIEEAKRLNSELPIPHFISPHDWRWYSGRWAFMDAEFAVQGVYPTWAFGEMGPVLDASPDWSGWLDPMGGWKHRDCLNGDFDKYLQVQKYWLDNVMQTPAYKDGRILGGTLFTSGAPGSGSDWSNFDLLQPQMDRLADFVREYDYTPVKPPDPPPPPENHNLLLNGSFESTNWKDFENADIQLPQHWIIHPYQLGRQIRTNAAKIYQEMVHKNQIGENPLPPDEWLGAKNALILNGVRTFKVFGSAPAGMRMSQRITFPKDGTVRLTLPANIHFDGRDPNKFEADDTLLEFGIGTSSTRFWMSHEFDRTWLYHTVEKKVMEGEKAEVWLDFSVDWGHHTAAFFDALRVEYIDEPTEPPLEECPGRPRVDYARLVHVLPQTATYSQLQAVTAEAYPKRQTVGFSYDDAGIGDLQDKTAVLWGIPAHDRQRYTDWYATHYPGTAVVFPNPQSPIGNHNIGLFVDVSHHQGAIEWNIMKAQGVTHCYIRASYGTKLSDTRYHTNVAGAAEAGIKFGAYHFFIYGAGGSDQAHFFHDIIKDDPGDLPPAIDFEKTDQISAPDPDQLRSCLNTVEDLTGRVPVIYTNIDSWHDLSGPQSWAARYPLWVACWTDRDQPYIPRDWDTWWLWQYGQTNGRPFGVQSSFIDLNRLNPTSDIPIPT